LTGRPDIALGNVLGSNIANILLILGLCALVTPLTISPASLRRDGLAMLGATLLFLLLASGAGLGRLDGFMLLAALAAFLLLAYRSELRDSHGPDVELHRAESEVITLLPPSTGLVTLALIGGLVLLVGGAHLFLSGAVGVGRSLGVPEAVIGLTLVAVGTSLPELAVSLIAVLRRQADVAVGNILGSNIFNLLGILGVSALLHPLSLTGRLAAIDQWVMLGAAGLLLAFLLTGQRLNRIEAALLLAAYGAYVALML
jgi:cation:H+ antiporter